MKTCKFISEMLSWQGAPHIRVGTHTYTVRPSFFFSCCSSVRSPGPEELSSYTPAVASGAVATGAPSPRGLPVGLLSSTRISYDFLTILSKFILSRIPKHLNLCPPEWFPPAWLRGIVVLLILFLLVCLIYFPLVAHLYWLHLDSVLQSECLVLEEFNKFAKMFLSKSYSVVFFF